VVELDLGHLEAVAPLRLVPKTILKRTARVLLSNWNTRGFCGTIRRGGLCGAAPRRRKAGAAHFRLAPPYAR
jgi:hypothetical protein